MNLSLITQEQPVAITNMLLMKRISLLVLLLLLFNVNNIEAAPKISSELQWPSVTPESRPWVFNWWMGSAVDKENLSLELRQFHDAGLGGLHIIPIYSAQGQELNNIEYLSPRWMEMLDFAVTEGKKDDLGVDMTLGTGWCFGGPNVPIGQSGMNVATAMIDPPKDGNLTSALAGMRCLDVIARASDGRRVDLTDRLGSDGHLNWTPDGPNWKLFVLSVKNNGFKVKRPAPGGAGYMLNPIDPDAMTNYLGRFSETFDKSKTANPRAAYHDSYEYQSQWSPELLAEFEKDHGYRLQDQLEAFSGYGDAETIARVKSDYRETVSDLMTEKVFPQWVNWSHQHGMISRYQAHGSPANWLDLYALADVPETEMFGHGNSDPFVSRFDADFGKGGRDPLISKFASSAAHVTGRKLVSAETGTWMAEHFCETLEEMKCFVDLMLVSGINHVFYHGTCYSPANAPWPGWVFYAATEMNPRNSIWHDVPTLNAYVTRCQSMLQQGTPDNDLLLYWPIYDLWHDTQGMLPTMSVHDRTWFDNQPIGTCAAQLWKRGYGFDYVSDKLLNQAHMTNGAISMANARYRTIVVPAAVHMPPKTLETLLTLAESGASIIFENTLPTDVPGLGHLEQQRQQLNQALARLHFSPLNGNVKTARLGTGRVFVGDLEASLSEAKITRETLVDHVGALFVRRRLDHGRVYFIANQSMAPMQGWFALGTPAKSVVLMDAMNGDMGVGQTKVNSNGTTRVYLHLLPGHSILLRTWEDRIVKGPTYVFTSPGQTVLELKNPWQVRFTEGGPTLPKSYTAATLASWTQNGDPETERFSGTAIYQTTFDRPMGTGPWVLDLGHVCHSARVRLNGQSLGMLIMAPYCIAIPSDQTLKLTGNVLEIEVTNLGANRIRDLDRRHIPWKVFTDANVVNINYKPFDASQWPVFDSGLLGPVTLKTQEPMAAKD